MSGPRRPRGWHSSEKIADRWTVTHDKLVFELKRTEFGHIGLFPEQAENWDWLAERVRSLRNRCES